MTDIVPTWYYIDNILGNYSYVADQYNDTGSNYAISISDCDPRVFDSFEDCTPQGIVESNICTVYKKNKADSQFNLYKWSGFWYFSQAEDPTCIDTPTYKCPGNPIDAYSLTRILTDKAKDYINKITTDATTKSSPFFLYLAYPAPHTPLYIHLKQNQIISTLLCGSDSGTDKCTPQRVHTECEKQAPDRQQCEINALYPHVIAGIDFNVGLLLDTICGGDADKDGKCDSPLYNNTIVIFTSDNGPYMGDAAQYPDRGSTGGLRGAKKFTYEGGTRVPFIARWPGKWLTGSSNTSPQLADMRDIFPTLVREALCPDREQCAAVTYDLNGTITKINGTDVLLDGKDISSILRNEKSSQNKDMQISWFGNFCICVYSIDGVCMGTGIGDPICGGADAEPSHPFAIRSNNPPTVQVTTRKGITEYTLNNFKLHITTKDDTSMRLGLPFELYDISQNLGELESAGRNLCVSYSTSLPYELINYCTKYCTPCTNTSTSLTCTSPANAKWTDSYRVVVENLWNNACNYDKKVRPELYPTQ